MIESQAVTKAAAEAPDASVGVTVVAYRLSNGSVARGAYKGLGDDPLAAIEGKIQEATKSGSLLEVNSIDTVNSGTVAVSPDHIVGIIIP